LGNVGIALPFLTSAVDRRNCIIVSAQTAIFKVSVRREEQLGPRIDEAMGGSVAATNTLDGEQRYVIKNTKPL
jgi:hypothetical protein